MERVLAPEGKKNKLRLSEDNREDEEEEEPCDSERRQTRNFDVDVADVDVAWDLRKVHVFHGWDGSSWSGGQSTLRDDNNNNNNNIIFNVTINNNNFQNIKFIYYLFIIFYSSNFFYFIYFLTLLIEVYIF